MVVAMMIVPMIKKTRSEKILIFSKEKSFPRRLPMAVSTAEAALRATTADTKTRKTF